MKLGMLYNHLSQARRLIIYLMSGLKLISCWDLNEHRIIIITIKNHQGKISVEFQESVNLERSYFTCNFIVNAIARQVAGKIARVTLALPGGINSISVVDSKTESTPQSKVRFSWNFVRSIDCWFHRSYFKGFSIVFPAP